MKERIYIAERTLYAVAAGGVEFEITLAVGKPYEVSSDEWACPVRLTGLHERLNDMHGIDSWQALQLACQLAAQLLGYFVEDGGKLFWEKDGEQVAIKDLFANVPAF